MAQNKIITIKECHTRITINTQADFLAIIVAEVMAVAVIAAAAVDHLVVE